MAFNTEIIDGIKSYVWSVAAHLGHVTPEERAEILQEVESHLYEALRARHGEKPTVDLQALLAEMPPPASYAEEATGTLVRQAADVLPQAIAPTSEPSPRTRKTPWATILGATYIVLSLFFMLSASLEYSASLAMHRQIGDPRLWPALITTLALAGTILGHLASRRFQREGRRPGFWRGLAAFTHYCYPMLAIGLSVDWLIVLLLSVLAPPSQNLALPIFAVLASPLAIYLCRLVVQWERRSTPQHASVLLFLHLMFLGLLPVLGRSTIEPVLVLVLCYLGALALWLVLAYRATQPASLPTPFGSGYAWQSRRGN